MSGYTQLQIVVPGAKPNYRDFTYTLRVIDHHANPPSTTTSSGAFNANTGVSAQHALAKLDVEILYDVHVRGQLIKSIRCNAYPANSKKISLYSFKTTTGTTHAEEDHTHAVHLDKTSVGWYLVKKPESFGSLVNRIYKNPSDADWAVMAANNPHLKNVQSRATMLLPGQVVVLSKSKTSPKLAQMRQDAVHAQAVWERIHAQHLIDDTYLNLLDLKLQGLAMTQHESEPYKSDSGVITSSVGMIEVGKPWADATLEFTKNIFESSTESYRKMMEAASPELNKVTTVGGMTKRAVNAAGNEAGKAYKLMDGSALARKLVQWDTGIQASSAREFIREEARVRKINYQKGITHLADEMEEVGKYSKWLKRTGYVGIAVEVGTSGYKIKEAAEKGDPKKVVEESGQLIGSVGGGWAGGELAAGAAVLIIGAGTGGLGLVVIGLFVALGAWGGSELGKAGAKRATDVIMK